jgi:hypothetical protein
MKLQVIGGPADGDEIELIDPLQPGEEFTLHDSRYKNILVRYEVTEDATLQFISYETI